MSESAVQPDSWLHIDALGPDRPYRPRARHVVQDVTGAPIAALTQVPRLYATRTLSRLRSAPASGAADGVAVHQERLARFADLVEHGVVGGIGPEDHHRLVARATGVPVSVVRAASTTIADAARAAGRSVEAARPRYATWDRANLDPVRGGVLWRRKGRLLGVHAAGNHPAVHSLWFDALVLGYRVVVRPSRRDPFTAHRVVLALRESGVPAEDVVLLPGDHDIGDEVVRGSDLAMVFGGDEVVRRYGQGGTPVLPQGPGRVKVLVQGPWESHLDSVVESVCGLAGVSCLNTTAVLADTDPAGLAAALAERLASFSPLAPEDDAAVLPCRPLAEARALAELLRTHSAGTTAVGTTSGIVHDLGDGSAALRPSVRLLPCVSSVQRDVELPFPCVWVAPWNRSDGVAPLRSSLVVAVAATEQSLVDDLLAEPTIHNLYGLDRPTWWLGPGLPHDGYLSEFLMRCSTVAGL
ncbi:aldehyde dehydrogenase family protein [Lentzea sp. NPDC004782]|uniref:aldehyde dehydrogenase family protein n=1 Tax=Lentzea sp. NPDC004782 TaxID=3154458 RepID=UPI0033B9A9D5